MFYGTPIKVSLTGDGEVAFRSFIQEHLTAIKNGLKELHTVKLPNWRRAYAAKPMEVTRSMPFENASNLVVPMVAIHADTLKARLLAALLKIKPVWVTALAGEWQGEGEDLREGLETFLGVEALEPDALDLYRVYNEALDDVVQYGTVTLKIPWLTLQHDLIVPNGDGSGSFDFVNEVEYQGPRPEKVSFEDFFMSPKERTLERATFKAFRTRLSKSELEERVFIGVFDKDAVASVLGAADRQGSTVAQSEAENDSKILSPSGVLGQEWDIYECWVWYRHGGHRCKLICWYHLASNTLLRTVYSNMPDDPMVGARLLNRDGSYYGRGMCEFLGMFQEELSQIHNQRRDAQTVANAKVWRVDPFSKLHDGYKIYPSAMLPAKKDEIEAIGHGEPSPVNIEEERMTLELAERRSGISPQAQAYGSGSFTKRGQYSSMGTLSLLQEGNTRTDMSVSDIRYFHTKVGRVLARQYAFCDSENSSRYAIYGKQAVAIRKALQAIKDGKMKLPISAPTASINREVEKQSDIMLTSLMTRHYQSITQMLAQVSSQQLPPEVKDYLVRATVASNKLMRMVLKHFDYDSPEVFAPDVITQQAGQQQQQPQPAAPQQTGDAGMVIPTGGNGLSGMGGQGAPVQSGEASVM